MNIAAALSGVLALVMLVIASHALRDSLTPEALERIQLGAFIQLIAAAAGLAIANREGRLNAIAGVLILGGAGFFSGVLYALSLTGERGLAILAPVGGIALILGWVVLVFAKPR
jgi:uncharacterized membrane protein YgdD (TMEM256/DUF423 family)